MSVRGVENGSRRLKERRRDALPWISIRGSGPRSGPSQPTIRSVSGHDQAPELSRQPTRGLRVGLGLPPSLKESRLL